MDFEVARQFVDFLEEGVEAADLEVDDVAESEN